MQPSAMIVCSAAAATPTLPTSRGYNAAITTHSGAGLYEVTLDDGIDAEECAVAGSCVGVDGSFAVVHVSDTVKRIVTYLAGVLDDTVEFSVVFYRLPAGHDEA